MECSCKKFGVAFFLFFFPAFGPMMWELAMECWIPYNFNILPFDKTRGSTSQLGLSVKFSSLDKWETNSFLCSLQTVSGKETIVKFKCSDNIGFSCFHTRGHPYIPKIIDVTILSSWDADGTVLYYCVHCNQVRMLSILNLSSSGGSVLTSVLWVFEFLKNHHHQSASVF